MAAAAERRLDGEINRALEGKKVAAVSKDGTFMTIHCDNGERWNVGWADFVKGVGFAGEPAIISVDEQKLGAGPVEVVDASIDSALRGEVIESSRTDGTVLFIQLASGRRYGIAWIDAKGERVRAEPCLHRVDAVLTLLGVTMLGAAPGDPNVVRELGDHANCGGKILVSQRGIHCTRCDFRFESLLAAS